VKHQSKTKYTFAASSTGLTLPSGVTKLGANQAYPLLFDQHQQSLTMITSQTPIDMAKYCQQHTTRQQQPPANGWNQVQKY
jgi:hypothetical protein